MLIRTARRLGELNRVHERLRDRGGLETDKSFKRQSQHDLYYQVVVKHNFIGLTKGKEIAPR
jgi:hypothetical protein